MPYAPFLLGCSFYIFLIRYKKCALQRTLAPERGCVGNHFPWARSAHLAERFCFIGNEISYETKKDCRNITAVPLLRVDTNYLTIISIKQYIKIRSIIQ